MRASCRGDQSLSTELVRFARVAPGLARKVFETKRCLVRSRGRPGLVAQDDDTRVMDDDPRSPGARGVRRIELQLQSPEAEFALHFTAKFAWMEADG